MPHNVGAVVSDIEDVKSDLHRNMKQAGRTSMGRLLFTAMDYVEADADWTGNLRRSLHIDVDDRGTEVSVTVSTDAKVAPYAPFVEFGTGSRKEQLSGRAPSTVISGWPDEGSRFPPSYPYKSPTMGPGLVQSIVDWVETKPVIPQNEGMTQRQLGAVIAAEIAEKGTYAHPFLRPAWFDNEMIIKQSMRNAVIRTFQ